MFKYLTYLILLASTSVVAGEHVGKIEKFELHSDSWGTYDPNDLGILSIYIEGLPKSCNETNGMRRIVITTDHPLFASVLSTVMAAHLADKEVTAKYLETCTTRSGAWNFGTIGM